MTRFVAPVTLVVSAGFVLLAACASSTPGVGSASRTQNDTFVVEINNENFLEATIHSRFEGAGERRLGTVFGHSRDTFVLRWQPGQLVFKVDLIGAGEFFTYPPIAVNPADFLELRLPVGLERGAQGFRRIR